MVVLENSDVNLQLVLNILDGFGSNWTYYVIPCIRSMFLYSSLTQRTHDQTVSEQGLESCIFRRPPFQVTSRNQDKTGVT